MHLGWKIRRSAIVLKPYTLMNINGYNFPKKETYSSEGYQSADFHQDNSLSHTYLTLVLYVVKPSAETMKCLRKHYSFLKQLNQQSSCYHMVRAGLYNFRKANFLFKWGLCLLPTKLVRYCSNIKVSHKHYSVGSQMRFIFPLYKLISGHIFTHMGQLLRPLSGRAITHVRRHQSITGISAYCDYMRDAHILDSQKMEDHNTNDKLQ
jgi:hypothetical protein